MRTMLKKSTSRSWQSLSSCTRRRQVCLQPHRRRCLHLAAIRRQSHTVRAIVVQPGEEPAEGFTNLLLILIEALFVALGLPDPVLVPKLLGLLSGGAVILAVWTMSGSLAWPGNGCDS